MADSAASAAARRGMVIAPRELDLRCKQCRARRNPRTRRANADFREAGSRLGSGTRFEARTSRCAVPLGRYIARVFGGTFRTDTVLFGLLLAPVIAVVGALTFLPADALGPIAQQLDLAHGVLRK